VTAPIRVAIVGMGKIARDQHLPAIYANPAFELVATVSPRGGSTDGRPNFATIEELAAGDVAVDAVSLCTPPQVRRALAATAIANGWHTFLEKPPATTLAEAITIRDAAAEAGVSLFASWHSRAAAGVESARDWLSGRTLRKATITWREDVRAWHPGQDWIFEPGGFGVFDPGINALSIATRIMPLPFFVEDAEVDEPANRAAPIAARVRFRDTAGVPIAMDLDFRQEGPQSWDIAVETDSGTLTLAQGGAVLSVPGDEPAASAGDLHEEYPRLYARFAELVGTGASDADFSPLTLVADTFLRARRQTVDPFNW
jgi:D-galactose 1-dehydrogenase